MRSRATILAVFTTAAHLWHAHVYLMEIPCLLQEVLEWHPLMSHLEAHH